MDALHDLRASVRPPSPERNNVQKLHVPKLDPASASNMATIIFVHGMIQNWVNLIAAGVIFPLNDDPIPIGWLDQQGLSTALLESALATSSQHAPPQVT